MLICMQNISTMLVDPSGNPRYQAAPVGSEKHGNDRKWFAAFVYCGGFRMFYPSDVSRFTHLIEGVLC
jgi:hypothetical protein